MHPETVAAALPTYPRGSFLGPQLTFSDLNRLSVTASPRGFQNPPARRTLELAASPPPRHSPT